MNLGSTAVSKVYLGSSEVSKIYLGSTEAWSSEFDPLSLSPAVWFDASDANTLYDATSGGSLVASDGSVKRIEDKSGNSRHASRGGSSGWPVRKVSNQNGLDTLQMGSILLKSASFSRLSEFTFFATAKATNWTSSDAYRPLMTQGYTGSSNWGIGVGYVVPSGAADWSLNDSLSFGNGYGSGATPRAIGALSSGSDWRLITVTFTSSSSSVRVNGTDITRVSGGGTVASGSAELVFGGNGSDTEFWAGNIGEMILCPPVTGGTLTDAETYLMNKWGI